LTLLVLFGSHTINTAIGRPLGTTLFTYQGHSDFVDAVAWSPNGRFIASGSWDHTVRVWNAKTQTLILSYAQGDIVDVVAWSPDGHFIAVGVRNSSIYVVDAKTGAPLHQNSYTNPDDADVVNTLAWSPDSHFIAVGGRDGSVQIWNVVAGTLLLNYKEHSNEV